MNVQATFLAAFNTADTIGAAMHTADVTALDVSDWCMDVSAALGTMRDLADAARALGVRLVDERIAAARKILAVLELRDEASLDASVAFTVAGISA